MTDKLPLYFIMLGIIALAVSGVLSFYSARDAMLERTFDQLISVRIEKQKRLESYFDAIIANANRLVKNNSHTRSLPHSGFVILNKDADTGNLLKVNLDGKFVDLDEANKQTLLKSDVGGKGVFIDIQIDDKRQLAYIQKSGNNEIAIYLISQDEINSIMLENNPHNGLGNSGEAYIVGSDSLMRSQSRFLANSVYQIKAITSSVAEALNGNTGVDIIFDYRGISVLSSYAPFNMPGIRFAIMAEIDIEEAMIPVYTIRNRIIIVSILISLIVFVVSFWGTRQIIKPILVLKDAALRIGKGDFKIKLPIVNNDEIGELTQTFNQMTSRIEEQTKELKAQRQKQLRSMIDGQEYERQRFSRELHDGLGQSLSAIKMQLEGSMVLTTQERDKKTKELLASIDSTIDEVRRMSNNLQPVLLHNFGLSTALINLCNEIAHSVPFNLMADVDEIDLTIGKRSQTYLFRIAQEGLNNIIKHAGATEVSLNFYQQGNELILSIEDNGAGFDTKQIGNAKGQGLENIIQRAGLINAHIDIQSLPGRGTIITVSLPIKCKENNGQD